jgi:hypothetical protein
MNHILLRRRPVGNGRVREVRQREQRSAPQGLGRSQLGRLLFHRRRHALHLLHLREELRRALL